MLNLRKKMFEREERNMTNVCYLPLVFLVLMTIGFIVWAVFAVRDGEKTTVTKQKKTATPKAPKASTTTTTTATQNPPNKSTKRKKAMFIIATVAVVILVITALLLGIFVPASRRPWLALWISLCGVASTIYCICYFFKRKEYVIFVFRKMD